MHYTAQNVFSGLASQYHLHDDMERRRLGIPVTPKAAAAGMIPPYYEFDVGLTLSDIMFQANAQQLYDDRTRSGLWGDVILVNGKAWPVMKVKRRIYRFRLLNASPSRSYRPTFSPAVPVYMIATDGGLMPKAKPVTSWRHGTAERYEFLIDFRNVPVGTKIEMRNLSNPNNRDYDNTNKIMRFDVIADAFDMNDPSWNSIPDELNPGEQAMNLKEKDATKVRNIQLKHDDVTNVWSLNGKTWEDVVASGFTLVLANPALGDTEIWELENSSGGWFHPLHIHLIDFRILTRNGRAALRLRNGPEGRRVRRRAGKGAGDHEIRQHRPVQPVPRPNRQIHDSLPQPGPRGPRHDGPVQRRQRRRQRPDLFRPGHPRRLTLTGMRWGVTAAAAVTVVVAAVIIRTQFIDVVTVSSDSMSPTVCTGDVVVLARLDGGDGVDDDDIVTFPSPLDGTPDDQAGGRHRRPECRHQGCRIVRRRTARCDEPYVDHASIDGVYTATVTVPPGSVFVLGDNREIAIDSRAYGPIPTSVDRRHDCSSSSGPNCP